jgi:hypothetical protein
MLLPGLALCHYPPNLHLQSNWDYRHMLLYPVYDGDFHVQLLLLTMTFSILSV